MKNPKTLSPAKLEKHLKALNTRHAKFDTELQELLSTPAGSINSTTAIAALKQKKCTTKTEILRIEAILAAATAATAPLQVAAPVIASPSEQAFEVEEPFFNIFTDTPAAIEARAA